MAKLPPATLGCIRCHIKAPVGYAPFSCCVEVHKAKSLMLNLKDQQVFFRIRQRTFKPLLMLMQRDFMLAVHAVSNFWMVAPRKHKRQIRMNHGSHVRCQCA